MTVYKNKKWSHEEMGGKEFPSEGGGGGSSLSFSRRSWRNTVAKFGRLSENQSYACTPVSRHPLPPPPLSNGSRLLSNSPTWMQTQAPRARCLTSLSRSPRSRRARASRAHPITRIQIVSDFQRDPRSARTMRARPRKLLPFFPPSSPPPLLYTKRVDLQQEVHRHRL